MNTNIISAPSKLSNVTVLAAIFVALIALEMVFRMNSAVYLVGIVGAAIAFFAVEKNTTGIRIALVACLYSAWHLFSLNMYFIIPAAIIFVAFMLPKVKPLTYYVVSTLFFGNLHLTYKLVGSMERGLDIIWTSFSSMSSGSSMILAITFVYAIRMTTKAVDTSNHHPIKKVIKSASSMGFLIASILGGLLTGVLLSIIEYKFVLLF
jgi:hypothetical protein